MVSARRRSILCPPGRASSAIVIAVVAWSAGCGQDALAPTDPDPAATVTKVAGDSQSATVNSAVAVPPSVRIAKASGVPVPGVAVAFQVSGGGGSVTGGDAITDSAGIASVGAWVLGERLGQNTLSATAGGATSVVFGATGLAGPPASITKIAGDEQHGDVWDFLAIRPSVAVQDTYGNPVTGVTVTFSIAVGGGEVYGASQITDGKGKTRVGGWRLGQEPGSNTLEATTGSLPAATFVAVAVNRCGATASYTFGSTVEGTVSSSSCRLWLGEYSDRWQLGSAGATSLQLDMRSSAFSPHVSLFDAVGTPLVSSQYYCPPFDYCGEATSLRVLLPAGEYVVGAGLFSYDYDDNPRGGVGGSYTLSSTAAPEDIHGCTGEAPVFIVPGVSTAQRIETADCADTLSFRGSRGEFFYDRIDVYLTAGETYTISMSSTEFDTYLELGPRYWASAFNDDFGGSSDSRITFTPTASGVYRIKATTHKFEATGSYILTLD